MPAPPADSSFSIAVADHVLAELRAALAAQNQGRTLAVFDRERLADYAELAGNLGALFQDYNQKYEALRVRYHILQVDEETGAAQVEFELEAVPAAPEQIPVRHAAQLRFRFARAGKDWKIVDVQPRNFFAGF